MILSLGMERAGNIQRQLHPGFDDLRSLVVPGNVAVVAHFQPGAAAVSNSRI
jgi:hypothetical protein